MNNAIACQHCGKIGYHMWAGEGGCPGADIQDEAYSEAMDEIERLKTWNQTLKQIVADDPEKHFYKALLTRAAAALEDSLPMKQYAFESTLPYYDLIAELRKAAE